MRVRNAVSHQLIKLAFDFTQVTCRLDGNMLNLYLTIRRNINNAYPLMVVNFAKGVFK